MNTKVFATAPAVTMSPLGNEGPRGLAIPSCIRPSNLSVSSRREQASAANGGGGDASVPGAGGVVGVEREGNHMARVRVARVKRLFNGGSA